MYNQLFKRIDVLAKALRHVEKDLHDVMMTVLPKLSIDEVNEYLSGYDFDPSQDPYMVLYERLENDIMGIAV